MALSKIKSNSIADDAITSDKVADGAVSAADVADGTLTNAKLADGTIENGKIADSTIANAKLSYPLTNSGATVSTFNRTSSDGKILELQKDGSAVGNISSHSSGGIRVESEHSLELKSSATNGLRLDDAGIFRPQTDNVTDVGKSTNRFKDLYLSGNIYLGGTGSANALDDYEEGEFTPTYITSGDQLTSITYDGFTGGSYVKVGRLVMITGFIRTDAITEGVPSGVLLIGGLPFAVAGASGGKLQTRGSISLADQNLWDTNHTPNSGAVAETLSYISLKKIYGDNDDASDVPSTGLATGANANQLRFTGTYLTDA